jgi:hypothetical protein
MVYDIPTNRPKTFNKANKLMQNIQITFRTYVWYATYIQYVAYWNLMFSGYTFVYNIIIHIKTP